MKKLVPVICFSIFSTIIYAALPTSLQTEKHQHSNSSTDGPDLVLGDGYLTYDHMSAGVPAIKMDATKVFYTNLQNSILLDDANDFSKLSKDLNVDISLSGGWGNFSGSAAANYLHHIDDTQYSENFTYTECFFSNAGLDISALPPTLNALKPDAAEIYKKEGIHVFTNKYGDTFIRQLPIGAYLIINLRLNFTSIFDKESFDLMISGKFGSIFSASAKVKNAVEKSNANGDFEVSAYQLGGDPSELANIFAKKTPDGYFITACKLSDLTACQAVIDGIIRYAQNDFKGQIKDNGKNAPTGKLAVVGPPILESYSNRFSLEVAPPLDATIIKQRLTLASIFNADLYLKNFFDHFTSSPVSSYFTPAAHQLIQTIYANINWNWSLFDQFGAIKCYEPGGENQCEVILKNIETNSKKNNPADIDYYLNTGFNEINTRCMYIPVGVPGEIFQQFAYSCGGTWLEGSYVFNMSADKKKLNLKSDYIAVNGHHIVMSAEMLPDESFLIYTGRGNFHDVSVGLWYYKNISMKLVRNKV